MSTEQENAAKWLRLEEYAKVKASAANLRGQLHTWGDLLYTTGKALKSDPTGLDLPSLKDLPKADALVSAIAELKQAESEYHRLAQVVSDLGVKLS